MEPEHFREYRVRVITEKLEAMPDLVDRLLQAPERLTPAARRRLTFMPGGVPANDHWGVRGPTERLLESGDACRRPRVPHNTSEAAIRKEARGGQASANWCNAVTSARSRTPRSVRRYSVRGGRPSTVTRTRTPASSSSREPRRERRRRDRPERLSELAEARCPLRRGPDDRHGPAPLEEVRRPANLLGNRLAATAAHVRRA